MTLQRIELHSVFLEDVEHYFKVFDVVDGESRLYKHVVHVHLHSFPDLAVKHSIDKSLIDRLSVLKPERHHFITIESEIGDKAGMLLIG